MTQVEERLKKVIVEKLGAEASKVIPQANFKTDLLADDLDMTQVFIATEEEFEITFDEDQIEKIETMRDLITLINKKSKK
ncbi:acyl carrier protein [Pseudomonas mosselii]|uniref:acyl carrier protein n=1 Tax=unclassified Pseudomonas TaxID=196821 RepID=UPI0020C51446|nr:MULTISPECIES: acyl carrier protein [unclassified Pseudomonas]MCP8634776.1 acyl carrier protein [Pseudomonas sp. DVZ6]MDD7784143.1 acyl carrier protein [Pseudomonas sp. DVZ24]